MKYLSFLPPTIVISLALSTSGAMQPAIASEETLIQPQALVIDHSVQKEKVDAEILVARRYGTFWGAGDEALARDALAPDFVDRTLPAGRVPGLPGVLAASKTMRAAIPDMTCEIEQLIVLGDRVVVHLRFRGHFTGQFKKTKGHGQAINFVATDIYRVTDGRITDNWHIEDNLTLLQQLGIIKG